LLATRDATPSELRLKNGTRCSPGLPKRNPGLELANAFSVNNRSLQDARERGIGKVSRSLSAAGATLCDAYESVYQPFGTRMIFLQMIHALAGTLLLNAGPSGLWLRPMPRCVICGLFLDSNHRVLHTIIIVFSIRIGRIKQPVAVNDKLVRVLTRFEIDAADPVIAFLAENKL